MKSKLITIAFIFLLSTLNAQLELVHSWHNTFTGTYDYTENSKVKINNDFVYIFGYAVNSVDFDPTAGTDLQSCNGAFISKYDLSGNYIYTIVLNGLKINDLNFDNNNDLYICGSFTGTVDFDPSAATVPSVSSIGGFTAKYLANGQYQGHIEYPELTFTNYIHFNKIVFDSLNYVYVAGNFTGTYDFDFTAGVDNKTALGNQDAFVLKANIDSGIYTWTKQFGGAASVDENITGFSINSQQELVMCGVFQGTADLDPGASTANFTSTAHYLFMAKWNTNGTYTNGISIGGSNSMYPEDFDMYIDANDKIYIGGDFDNDSMDMDPSVSNFIIHKISPSSGSFVASYNSDLSFNWAKSLSYCNPKSIASTNNQLYLTGNMNGALFEETNTGNSLVLPFSGIVYPYLMSLSPDSGNISYSYGLASAYPSATTTFAVDNVGNLYLQGFYEDSIDIDPMHGGLYIPTASLIVSTFVVKYNVVDHAGIQSQQPNAEINVFPNPASNNVNIVAANHISDLRIFDPTGKLTYSKTNINSNQVTLDVSTLPQGIYFIELYVNKKKYTTKLIKTS